MKILLCKLPDGGKVSSDSVGVSSRARIAGRGFPQGHSLNLLSSLPPAFSRLFCAYRLCATPTEGGQ